MGRHREFKMDRNDDKAGDLRRNDSRSNHLLNFRSNITNIFFKHEICFATCYLMFPLADSSPANSFNQGHLGGYSTGKETRANHSFLLSVLSTTEFDGKKNDLNAAREELEQHYTAQKARIDYEKELAAVGHKLFILGAENKDRAEIIRLQLLRFGTTWMEKISQTVNQETLEKDIKQLQENGKIEDLFATDLRKILLETIFIY